MGAGNVLAVKRSFLSGLIGPVPSLLLLLHWPGALPLVAPSLARAPINLLSSRSPSSLKLFFPRGRNRVTTNSCNRSHSSSSSQQRQGNTLSIIHTSVADTRLQNKKKRRHKRRRLFFLLYTEKCHQNKLTNNKTCCEATFSPCTARMKTWKRFLVQINLSSCRLPTPVCVPLSWERKVSPPYRRFNLTVDWF